MGVHKEVTCDLIRMLEHNSELKDLLEKSIQIAAGINPDPDFNPIQSLEDYYNFADWACCCLPWEYLEGHRHSKLYERIDQSTGYFYFISDQPLEELKGRGYFNNSVMYMEPYRTWLIEFISKWGKYLSTPGSWNEDYYRMACDDERFGLNNGQYEDHANWHSFNEFFSRKLSSPASRPICQDARTIAAPCDSEPQGIWQLDADNMIIHPAGVTIKSRKFNDVGELLFRSKYKDFFRNGTLTHTFLDIMDYHRYHFPLDGKVLEIQIIPGDDAAGGITTWCEEKKKYLYDTYVGWQMIETRACIIMDTVYGKVALLPIGMSQISSVNLEKNIRPGVTVKKGDPLGYFLFGGSDFVMVFEKQAGFQLACPGNGKGGYLHISMGEAYGTVR